MWKEELIQIRRGEMKKLIVLALVLGFAGSAFGAIAWNGSVSTDYSDGNNWDGGVVPGNGDSIVFDAGDICVFDIGAGNTAELNNIIQSGLDTGASLTLNSGTMRTSTDYGGSWGDVWWGDGSGGTITVNAGASLVVDHPDAYSDLQLTGNRNGTGNTLNVNGGIVNVNGTIGFPYHTPSSYQIGGDPGILNITNGGLVIADDIHIDGNLDSRIAIGYGALILRGDQTGLGTNLMNAIEADQIVDDYGHPIIYEPFYDEWNHEGYGYVTIVTPIPEPATIALLGMGALALIRKRR